MSAKVKLREDLAMWKGIAAKADRERLEYAHMLIGILNKMGGTVVVTAENMRAFTTNHAVQADHTADGGARIVLLVKTPENRRG